MIKIKNYGTLLENYAYQKSIKIFNRCILPTLTYESKNIQVCHDGISNEHIKYGKDKLIRVLTHLYNTYRYYTKNQVNTFWLENLKNNPSN